MSQEIIKQALAMAHEGQLAQSRTMLMDMLRQDPDNLSGWGNLYRLCYNDTERKVCLQNILRLRPMDEWATRKMAELQADAEPPEDEPEQPEPVETEEVPVPEEEIATAVTRRREEVAEPEPIFEDDLPTAATREQEEVVDEDPVFEEDLPTAATREQEEAVDADPVFEDDLPTAVTREQEAAVDEDSVFEDDLPTAVSREQEDEAPIFEEDIPTAVTRQREDALRARTGYSEVEPEPEYEPEPEPEYDPEPEPEPDYEPEPEYEPGIEETPTIVVHRRDGPAEDVLAESELPDLVNGGVLTVKAAAFLKAAVLARISVLVSGEESVDAHSLLDTMAQLIPADAPERMVQRNLTAETVMMFAAAMLAGGGAMGSLKAPSVTTSIGRLEVLMANAHPDDVMRHREIIVGGLEMLVHIQRLDDDRPYITAIYEVIGLREDEVRIEPVFVYGMGSGLLPTGHRPAVMNTIEQMGLALPREVFLPT